MRGFSEGEIKATIADLEDFFTRDRRRIVVGVFNTAWRTWITSILRYLPDCPKRTRRAVIWTLLLNEARARFGDDANIVFRETRQGHFFFQIPGSNSAGSILIRFKFLTEDLHTRNYPTETALDYNRQIPLPGIPAGIRIDVGYRLNADETALIGIFAVWSVGLTKLWVYQLDSTYPHVIEDITSRTAASSKPIRRTRVKKDLDTGKDEETKK